MSGYKQPDFNERRNDAATARKALLERAKIASADPAIAERIAERAVISAARQQRAEIRATAKRQREAEAAAEAARLAELAAQAQREAEAAEVVRKAEEAERALALLVEQKAARDARYAARKAAKKQRRKG